LALLLLLLLQEQRVDTVLHHIPLAQASHSVAQDSGAKDHQSTAAHEDGEDEAVDEAATVADIAIATITTMRTVNQHLTDPALLLPPESTLKVKLRVERDLRMDDEAVMDMDMDITVRTHMGIMGEEDLADGEEAEDGALGAAEVEVRALVPEEDLEDGVEDDITEDLPAQVASI
jgi:hypothetical protein